MADAVEAAAEAVADLSIADSSPSAPQALSKKSLFSPFGLHFTSFFSHFYGDFDCFFGVFMTSAKKKEEKMKKKEQERLEKKKEVRYSFSFFGLLESEYLIV